MKKINADEILKGKKRDRVFLKSSEEILREVKEILNLISESYNSNLEKVFLDVIKVFKGEYPGYQKSKTKYHNLNHTLEVALTAVRLIHAAIVKGKKFKNENIRLCIMAALFHDLGLIQKEDEPKEGTGAKYTIGHEQRSIDFARTYLLKEGGSQEQILIIKQMIECTILNKSTQDIEFINEEIKFLGKVVGTSDVLAQVSDREYLEKLGFLYDEFLEAKITVYESDYELLNQTEFFYNNLSKTRLSSELGNIDKLMINHFKAKFDEEVDYYQEAIKANITYLNEILKKGEVHYRKMLRREVRRNK